MDTTLLAIVVIVALAVNVAIVGAMFVWGAGRTASTTGRRRSGSASAGARGSAPSERPRPTRAGTRPPRRSLSRPARCCRRPARRRCRRSPTFADAPAVVQLVLDSEIVQAWAVLAPFTRNVIVHDCVPAPVSGAGVDAHLEAGERPADERQCPRSVSVAPHWLPPVGRLPGVEERAVVGGAAGDRRVGGRSAEDVVVRAVGPGRRWRR